jgi:hypothetical protein
LNNYIFIGYPAFLERAAEDLGLDPAGRSAPGPLAAMANLCAQASTAEPAHVPEILAEAAAHRDHLLGAARAAGLMLADVAQARSADLGSAPPRRAEEAVRPRPSRPSNRPSSHRP